MKQLFKGFKGAWYFFWGHLLALFFYDKRFLRGRWFTGKFCGLCAPGWEWAVRGVTARLAGRGTPARFPVSPDCRIIFPQNLVFHPDDLNNFQTFGCYYQAAGTITLGRGTYIAPNVGLITSNHDLLNPDEHSRPEPITLGEQCWVGMNSVILPGVTLGDHTIVGAGSVVTKSFPAGHCVIAGNPARVLRELLRDT